LYSNFAIKTSEEPVCNALNDTGGVRMQPIAKAATARQGKQNQLKK
jgi:hypothetical protein